MRFAFMRFAPCASLYTFLIGASHAKAFAGPFFLGF